VGIREDFMEKLVEVTKKLNRQVTASDFLEAKQDDKSLPDPNDYAFYWKDFNHAAKQAYIEGTPWPKGDKEVDVMKRVRPCSVSKAKQEQIIDEIVDLYIKNDGVMPSNRQIKHNQLIKENDVSEMRWAGLINELDIRKRAEEKSGRTFSSSTEGEHEPQKTVVVSDVVPEEVKKVNEEEVREAIEVAKEEVVLEESAGPKLKQRSYIRKTDEQLWAEIREKCKEAGHILTDAEIKADDTLSAPQTYYNRLGKGYRSAIFLETAPPSLEPEIKVGPAIEAKPKWEMTEIPIKLIVPKGIKGTITLNLEF